MIGNVINNNSNIMEERLNIIINGLNKANSLEDIKKTLENLLNLVNQEIKNCQSRAIDFHQDQW